MEKGLIKNFLLLLLIIGVVSAIFWICESRQWFIDPTSKRATGTTGKKYLEGVGDC